MRLTDVCDFQGGSQPPKEEWSTEKQDGYIRMLQIRDFTQGERVVPEYIKITKSTKICEADDILIARYGASIGKILTGLAGAYNVAIMRTIPDPSMLRKRYIYYYFNSPYFQRRILNVGVRAAQAGFNKEDLSELEIDCPALLEQDMIVNLLKKVEHIIRNRQQELSALDDLIKARFVEMFGDCKANPKGWNTVPLGEIADVGSSKRVFVDELQETGIPFYRGTEVGTLAEGKSVTPELFITQEHYQELISATGKPEIGDLLMPSICPDGRIWVIDTEKPFYFKDGRVLWVHSISDKFDPIFLLYTLKDRIMTDYSSIASGTTFAELKIFSLKQCLIFDVPLKLQKQFSAFIKQTAKTKAAVQKALDEAQLLFDSLLQKYFN